MPGLVGFLDLSAVFHYRQESIPYTIWLAQWVERLVSMPKTLGSILQHHINQSVSVIPVVTDSGKRSPGHS